MFCDYVLWLCLMTMFCDYVLWLCVVTMCCDYVLWLCFVIMFCDYVLWLCFVTMRCDHVLWLCFRLRFRGGVTASPDHHHHCRHLQDLNQTNWTMNRNIQDQHKTTHKKNTQEHTSLSCNIRNTSIHNIDNKWYHNTTSTNNINTQHHNTTTSNSIITQQQHQRTSRRSGDYITRRTSLIRRKKYINFKKDRKHCNLERKGKKWTNLDTSLLALK